MPEDAVQVDRYFRHKVGHVQLEAFLGIAALGEGANEVMLVRNPERSVKRAQLLQIRRIGGCFGGPQSEVKPFCLEPHETLHSPPPRTRASVRTASLCA